MQAAQPKAPSHDDHVRDVTSLLSKAKTYCLNEDPSFPHANLFIGDDRLVLRSDTDSQLLIHCEFNETVKLVNIVLTSPQLGGALSLPACPKVLKLYVNRNNMGFSDAEDVEPVQSFELSESDLRSGRVVVPLKFVKFQRVNSISLFVEDNFGEEFTAIGSIRFQGSTLQGTNMNELKKC